MLLAAAAPAGASLHTKGRFIVDRDGHRVKLASVNWFGGESGEFVVGGLDKQPLLEDRAHDPARRLQLRPAAVVERAGREEPGRGAGLLSANPRLQGKRALSVFDAVVEEAGRQGLMVILDNHRSRGDWCCDEDHGDGLWYTAEYPESAWIADWKAMARRYRDDRHVVAGGAAQRVRPDPSLAPGRRPRPGATATG